MRVIAIDPGWNGACALFINNKLEYTKRCPTDRSIHKMSQIVHEMIDNKKTEIYIEKVWSRPYERGAFSFGTNFGAWLGIIASNNIVELQITPKAWQKVVGIRIPKEYGKRKNYFKRRAQRWAGKKHKVTLTNADAICLGMYVIERKKSES